MSLFQRTFLPLRASTQAIRCSRSNASFSTTTTRAVMSENDHDHPERGAHIDKHKQDSVNRAKSGSGEWKPELATKSEQDVQAEKHNMSMEEMQKLGEKKAQEGKEPSGSSSNKV